MGSKIIKLLEEQSGFGFSGKINIPDKFSGQYWGHFTMSEGQVHDCWFKSLSSRRALLAILSDEQSDEEKLSYVVEPEIIESSERNLDYTIEELKALSAGFIVEYRESSKLKPNENLKLGINYDFISQGDEIDATEFDVLCMLSDYNP